MVRVALCLLVACSANPRPTPTTSPASDAAVADAIAVVAVDAADGPPVEIVAGALHTCARMTNGTVRCWGADRVTPERVVGIANAAELAAGENHTCARLADGGVRCWELGGESTKVEIDGVTAISASRNHTCALRSDHTAWCWGANDGGQASDTDGAKLIVKPARANRADVVEVRAGVQQTCARLRDGTVSCWGDRDALRGQARKPLAAVAGIANAEELAVGFYGACARVGNRVACWPATKRTDIPALDDVARLVGNEDRYCAIDGKRAASCWTGPYGWLHLRGVTRMPSLDGADQIALGRFHSCALRRGIVSCSGENLHGQLGNGSKGYVVAPLRVPGMRGATHVDLDGFQAPCAVLANGDVACVRSDVPRNLHGVVELADRCARLATGAVTCWGDNRAAELGRASPGFSLAALQVPGIAAGATSLSAFGSTRCAVVKSRVKCWGNDNGVSIHDLSADPKRVEIAPVDIAGIRDAVSVSIGYSLACALLKSKTVTCWKLRDYAAGTVTRYGAAKPQAVAGVSNAIQISVGRDTAGAVLEDGSLVLWGLDLGTGMQPQPPTPVPNVADAVELRVGSHACMRHRDGRVSCWGRIGSLDGLLLDSATPLAIPNIANAVGLATSSAHDCARLADGDVACWGTNRQEELGVPLGEEAPPSVVRF